MEDLFTIYNTSSIENIVRVRHASQGMTSPNVLAPNNVVIPTGH